MQRRERRNSFCKILVLPSVWSVDSFCPQLGGLFFAGRHRISQLGVIYQPAGACSPIIQTLIAASFIEVNVDCGKNAKPNLVRAPTAHTAVGDDD